MRRIVVINPKGGCGKTTLATNLASYFAHQGHRTALMDYDLQGSSWQWLQLRGPDRPRIEGIRAAEAVPGTTRVWQTRPPEGTERLVIDTPAALDNHRIAEATRGAQAIIIPVLPSNIDIHAASRCIGDLLIRARVSRRGDRIAVVANRVRQNTKVYAKLERFLSNLDIPFVASLRDSQNYVHAVEHGLGIFELPEKQTRKDRGQWHALIDWIESRPIHQLVTTGLSERPVSR
ncbi:chromosome partitioning protein [Natronospira proteinivora]|uniref:Chromosome partitioning protein n=1 Tax=Natronospira proteinivora TaxID=1807133 RepID=A0ABT1G6X8_9GAMM|nr:AAA family ATPase [Natronospira proteinivora]MCP1726068.1 chromosome partitioning protein [Natronospira proteinivora]